MRNEIDQHVLAEFCKQFEQIIGWQLIEVSPNWQDYAKHKFIPSEVSPEDIADDHPGTTPLHPMVAVAFSGVKYINVTLVPHIPNVKTPFDTTESNKHYARVLRKIGNVKITVKDYNKAITQITEYLQRYHEIIGPAIEYITAERQTIDTILARHDGLTEKFTGNPVFKVNSDEPDFSDIEACILGPEGRRSTLELRFELQKPEPEVTVIFGNFDPYQIIDFYNLVAGFFHERGAQLLPEAPDENDDEFKGVPDPQISRLAVRHSDIHTEQTEPESEPDDVPLNGRENLPEPDDKSDGNLDGNQDDMPETEDELTGGLEAEPDDELADEPDDEPVTDQNLSRMYDLRDTQSVKKLTETLLDGCKWANSGGIPLTTTFGPLSTMEPKELNSVKEPIHPLQTLLMEQPQILPGDTNGIKTLQAMGISFEYIDRFVLVYAQQPGSKTAMLFSDGWYGLCDAEKILEQFPPNQ